MRKARLMRIREYQIQVQIGYEKRATPVFKLRMPPLEEQIASHDTALTTQQDEM